jgi:DNA (cytosine-5)-methyltransferase 1
MLTVGSLFSGIGGIDLAFQSAGFDITYQVEIDDYCQKVLSQHWPEVRRYRDIFTVDADTLPAADVIAAGFPCQPFSVAGNQRGESDERFLWPEILRIVTVKRPAILFLENVPGLRTINGGTTFKRILRELAEIGYDAQWHHLRASDVGAPHRRERLFIVAYTQDSRADRGQRVKRDDAASGGQNGERKRIIPNGRNQTVGNAAIMGCKGVQSQPGSDSSSPNKRGLQEPKRGSHRQTQSRLGGGTARVSGGLDRHQFPAPPGEPYAWEPPRTTTQTENRTARIKALGNSVVPQVIYPIALAIREYLEQPHV